MERTPEDIQALINLGQSIHEYIINNSIVVIVEGKTLLCSKIPASEEALCQVINIVGNSI